MKTLSTLVKFGSGVFEAIDRPGLGVSVQEEKVESFRVDAITSACLDRERPDWFPVKPSY